LGIADWLISRQVSNSSTILVCAQKPEFNFAGLAGADRRTAALAQMLDAHRDMKPVENMRQWRVARPANDLLSVKSPSLKTVISCFGSLPC
jgi:hypothetical protein